jgi:hypothetical protein
MTRIPRATSVTEEALQMTQTQALLTLLAFGIAASVISKRYLTPEAQILVAGIGLIGAVSTLSEGARGAL